MAKKRGGAIKKTFDVEKIHQQIQSETMEFILQGYSLSEVVEYLELNYNISTLNARKYYRNAHLDIMNLGEFDIETIIVQHIYYYEEASKWFDSIDDYDGKSKAMNAKEKLLKLFEEEESEIEINNNITVNVEQLHYDVEKLNVNEKDRFNEIIQKVRLIGEDKR